MGMETMKKNAISIEEKKKKESMNIAGSRRNKINFSDDVSFENRYKELLEGINEEKVVPLPNPHENDIVESIDEIDCAEDGFIARYCLGDVVSIDEMPQLAKSMVLKK